MSNAKSNKSLDELITRNKSNQKKIEVVKKKNVNYNNNSNYRNNRKFNRRFERNNKFNRYQKPSFREKNTKNNFNQPRKRIIIDRSINKPSGGTRLSITNLHPNIINSELKIIFEKIGPLKRCGIHWDELGNSKGTADVEFYKPQDAQKAIDEYNLAEVEGKIIKIQHSNINSDNNVNVRVSIGPKRIIKKNIRRRNFNK